MFLYLSPSKWKKSYLIKLLLKIFRENDQDVMNSDKLILAKIVIAFNVPASSLSGSGVKSNSLPI
mgnify:CR=1 FL=1